MALACEPALGQFHSMNGYQFTFAGQSLEALPSGALHWPAQGLLCVSDLHLGKSRRLARRGGTLIPPYEVAETLARLDADIDKTGPRSVICLGDSFDDSDAMNDLEEGHQLWLLRLMAGRDWVWIAGNHDPAPLDLGGTHKHEVVQTGLTFRHIAKAGARAEISGHYHPKARLKGQSRPCFIHDEERLILPAYGTYTGGLWADAPEIQGLFSGASMAILTGRRCLAIPLQPMKRGHPS